MSPGWKETLDELEKGTLRAAFPAGSGWEVDTRVKQAILDTFKAGENIEFGGIYAGFVDKNNLPPQAFSPSRKIRFVPGGSSVRRGAYLAPGVIVMPPSYVNIGAYVDEGSMIDSHVLVGSCAQIGKNVHLSAGVQIGGVLEPIGLRPVIVEDGCFIGAGAILVEGVLVKKGAVIAPGVVLSKSVPVYDCIQKKILGKGEAIPENAVVIPGTRPIKNEWASGEGLSVACPVIIKYRDARSDASLVLEDLLR